MPRKQKTPAPAAKKPRKTPERIDLTGQIVALDVIRPTMTLVGGPRSLYDREILALQAEAALKAGTARAYPLKAQKGFLERAAILGVRLGMGEHEGRLVVWVEGKTEKPESKQIERPQLKEPLSLSPILEPELATPEELAELRAGVREY